MKHAYYEHNKYLRAYKEAKTSLERTTIAVHYFEHAAEIVNEEMKKNLEEEKP